MSDNLNGKVVLVTGGTSGIGRDTAVAFGARGAKVVVAGRREDEGATTVKLIRDGSGEAHFVRTDVTQSAQVAALVAEVVGRYGALDIAFNNAGYEGTPYVPLEKYTEQAWHDVIEINLKGLFLCMKYELPHLVESKGAMVNMASVAGLTGGRLGAARDRLRNPPLPTRESNDCAPPARRPACGMAWRSRSFPACRRS